MSGARALARVSAIAAVAPIAAIGCSGASTPAPGQVMLVLETDGGVGRGLDFDRIAVVVTDARAGGQIVRNYEVGAAQLPGTIAIVAGGASEGTDAGVAGAPVTKVEVFATDAKGVLRIYQALRLTLPREGVRTLRMALEAACDGVLPEVACPGAGASCAVAPTVVCRPEQACHEGRCIPVHELEVRDLPAYDPATVASCGAEPDAEVCARRGASCGSYLVTDRCGALRTVRCGDCPGEREATTARLAGPGLDDCGPLAIDSCARSPLVPGGTLARREGAASSTTVSDFRLDKYEVTVGRFRRFVDAWLGGWRPAPGSGKHAHLGGGAGLEVTTGGFEAGWDLAWSAYVGAAAGPGTAPSGPSATTRAAWDAALRCDRAPTAYHTWTPTPGPNETRPQSCLSWYDLHAFCIWDGGFLPSDAEWAYAAAGGSYASPYPWGTREPGADARLAVYGCLWSKPLAGSGDCTADDLPPVGSAPAGDARWGQSDLAGGLWEWGLDRFRAEVPGACRDCVDMPSDPRRVIRGGSFLFGTSSLGVRLFNTPASRDASLGGRCARRP